MLHLEDCFFVLAVLQRFDHDLSLHLVFNALLDFPVRVQGLHLGVANETAIGFSPQVELAHRVVVLVLGRPIGTAVSPVFRVGVVTLLEQTHERVMLL